VGGGRDACVRVEARVQWGDVRGVHTVGGAAASWRGMLDDGQRTLDSTSAGALACCFLIIFFTLTPTQGRTGPHRATQGYTGPHRATQGHTGPHRATQGHTKATAGAVSPRLRYHQDARTNWPTA